MPRKQVGGIMDMIKDYANKATDMAKDSFEAAKGAVDGENEEQKRRKHIARQRVQSKVQSVTPTQHAAPVMPQAGGKRRRGGRKGGRKGGRTRKAGMCGVCTGGSRKGGRKTKRKRGGKKTHKKRKGRSGLGSVKRMVERYL